MRETTMTKVYTGASMSLDGYVAGPNESGFEHLFAWYQAGDNEFPTAMPPMTFNLTDAGAAHVREVIGMSGALVVGRRSCSTSPTPGAGGTRWTARWSC
jgi:hypothetical protein